MLLPKITKRIIFGDNFKKPVVLDDRVDAFIEWYKNNMVNGHYTDIGEYLEPIELRNLIEKMAVWYELRFPDYEVNRMMPGSNQENNDVDNVMFNDNSYINEVLDSDSEVRVLDWDKFYNFDAFLKSLSVDERYYFRKYQYPSIVYFDKRIGVGHLHLDSDGIVEMDEFSFTVNKGEGKHIKEVVEEVLKTGIKFPADSEMLEVIKNAENKDIQIDEMLNAVMYRIIERGGNRIGARRAYLFAKEFKRNLDIPIMYGIDPSDPGLRAFINMYLIDGGNPDLVCYMNYGSRESKYEPLWTTSVIDLLKTYKDFYTAEEKELHQRLVNALSRRLEK